MQSLLDDRGWDVMGDALFDVARRALFITVGVRNQEFPDLHFLGAFLKRYTSAVVVIDGREIESLSEGNGLTCSPSVSLEKLRRDGLPPFLFHDAYQDAVMRAGGPAHARFDPKVLHKIAPTSWVSIISALLVDGPDVGAARAQAAIYDYSLETVEGNRRRVTGRRSRSSVKLVFFEAARLLRIAHSLRGLPSCRHWTHVPELAMPDMPKGGYETVAPRVETVRQAWQAMTSEIHERLGVGTIEDEIRALDALTDDTLASRGLWRPVRDRVLLVLMVLTGGRRNAMARLCREDYIPDCEGPIPDCRRGAALDLRPRKGKGRDEVRRKPIPRQAALVLDTYLTLMDRMLASSGHAPAPPYAPLLVAEPSHYAKPIRQQWLYHRVAGGKTNGWLPLVSRDARHVPKHVTEEERPYCGYTPHEYRHFANQLAERAGEVWNERYPATGGETNPPTSYYAAALLDNGGIEQDLRALYGDRRTPAMLEVVSGRRRDRLGASDDGHRDAQTPRRGRLRAGADPFAPDRGRGAAPGAERAEAPEQARPLRSAGATAAARSAGRSPRCDPASSGGVGRLDQRAQGDHAGEFRDHSPARAALPPEGGHDHQAGHVPARPGDLAGGAGLRAARRRAG
jgi:integrase